MLREAIGSLQVNLSHKPSELAIGKKTEKRALGDEKAASQLAAVLQNQLAEKSSLSNVRLAEWIPSSAAVERLPKKGHSEVSLPNIKKWSDRGYILTRARQLDGRHRIEVEWLGLLKYVIEKANKRRADKPGEDEPCEQERNGIEKRKNEADRKRGSQGRITFD